MIFLLNTTKSNFLDAALDMARVKKPRGILLLVFVFLIIVFLPNLTHASFIGASAVDRPGSTLSNGLVAHWTFDGSDMINNVADVSGNSNHGRFIGFTSTSSVQVAGPVGQAFKFDGVSNHYVSVPASVTDFSTSDFSISFWAKFGQAETPNRGVMYKGTYGTRGWGIWRSGGGSGTLSLATKITGGAGYNKSITVDKYPKDEWAHFVWVVDRDNTANSKVYVNGVSQTTTGSIIGVTAMEDIDSLMLGGWSYADEAYFPMDDVRLYSRVLSDSEIRQLYNQNVSKIAATPPKVSSTGLNSGLVGHWTFDGKDLINNVADRSGNGNNGYMTGFTSTSTAVNVGTLGQSLKFDGSNDVVDVKTPASLQISNATISARFKTSNAGSSYRGIILKTRRFNIFLKDNKLAVYDWNVGDAYVSSGTYNDNRWHLVNVVFQTGITNGSSIYVDGQLLGNFTWNVYASGDCYVSIGAQDTNCAGSMGSNFNGLLDDVRVYNRTLSATEIEQLYNQSATKFAATPPKQSSTGLNSGLVGYWTFDGKDLINNVADRSGTGNNGYMTGFTSTSSAVVAGKFGQALYFSGASNSYINVGQNSSLSLGTADFTISFWLNRTPDSCGWIFSNKFQLFYDSSCAIFTFRKSGGTETKISSLPTVNMWVNVIIRRSSGTMTAYYDGVSKTLSAGGTNNDDISNSTLDLYFGHNTNALKSKIDEIRIYSRALSATEIMQLYNMGR
jgi:hypothetical protein